MEESDLFWAEPQKLEGWTLKLRFSISFESNRTRENLRGMHDNG